MISIKRFAFALGLLLVFSTWPALAQSSPSQSTPAPGQGTPGTSRRSGGARGEPCWKQIGISQSVAQKHHQIEQSTRSEVESVCNDSSLSAQQKQDKIRQLHEQERKQMEALITPQQEQQLKACREQRREGAGAQGGGGGEKGTHRGGAGAQGGGGEKGMHRGGGESPCGQLASGGKSAHESEPDSDQQ